MAGLSEGVEMTTARRGMALLVGATLAFGACGGVDPTYRATKKAHAAIATLKLQLKQRLQAAMAEGPEKAVEVCANEAQLIRQRVSDETGVTLGRASLRLRTAADAAPDWVNAWLVAQGERKVEGVTGLELVEASRVRVLEPIGMDGLCLSCHGEASSLSDAVASALKSRYPNDAATGYAAGDLRGAFWAEINY